MSIMALAREHLAGDHARLPVSGCGLCPACPTCGGRGSLPPPLDAMGLRGSYRSRCDVCSGTGSTKGDKR